MRVGTLNVQLSLQKRIDRIHLQEVLQHLDKESLDLLLMQEIFVRKEGRFEDVVKAEGLNWPFMFFSPCTEFQDGIQGNAILSKVPIHRKLEEDLARPRRQERRAQMGWIQSAEHGEICIVNIHLGLKRWERKSQLSKLSERLNAEVSEDAPLILGGDFNAWGRWETNFLRNSLGVKEVKSFRTFPAKCPVLSLDRFFYRGLHATQVRRPRGKPWSQLSDHLPLFLDLDE